METDLQRTTDHAVNISTIIGQYNGESDIPRPRVTWNLVLSMPVVQSPDSNLEWFKCQERFRRSNYNESLQSSESGYTALIILVYPMAASDRPSGGTRFGGIWGHEGPDWVA